MTGQHAAAIMQGVGGWRPCCICGWRSRNVWVQESAAKMMALRHERRPTDPQAGENEDG